MHAAIRADPVKEKKSRSKPSETKNWKPAKLTYDERKANLKVSLHYLPPHSCELAFLSFFMWTAPHTLRVQTWRSVDWARKKRFVPVAHAGCPASEYLRHMEPCTDAAVHMLPAGQAGGAAGGWR